MNKTHPRVCPTVSSIIISQSISQSHNYLSGAISHNQCLELYKKHVDPSYTWTNFTLEEQSKILAAGRSNNTLDHTKLCAALPDIKINDIHTAMEQVMIRMRANLEREPNWPDILPRRS